MKRLLFLVVIALVFINISSKAQGDLLVTPLRVVFDGKSTKEELSLVNIGNDTAVYSVSFLQYNMTEEGQFEIIEKPGPGQMFANSYLRIFPRNITLAPHEGQVVRLQYRKSKDMIPGEYRSHIYFRSEKNNKALGIEKTMKDSSMMGVQITPIYGISIPVIIREGNVSLKSGLTDLIIEKQDTNTVLKVTITREGNISSYGDVVVDYVGKNGKSINIGLVKGVSVYTTVNKRYLKIKLDNLKNIDLTTGKLKVTYTSPSDTPYSVIAEKDLILN